MRPQYFVRVVRKRANALACLVKFLNSKSKEDAEAFVQWVFGGESTWSVFALKQRHRHDEGHALGLLAAMIANSDFDAEARERYRAKVNRWADAKTHNRQAKADDLSELIRFNPPMTIVLPCSLFDEDFKFNHSPDNNLAFFPADELHYDISGVTVECFTAPISNAILQDAAIITVLTREDFRTQAAIALSSCLRKYAACVIPARTPKPHTLNPAEQMERLRTIAGDFGWQSFAIETST